MTVKEFADKIMGLQRETMSHYIDEDDNFPHVIAEFDINIDPDYKSELARIIAEFKEQL